MTAESPENPASISIEGRIFAGVSNAESGEVGPSTKFTYHEDEATIWADYSGGQILRGHLVGTRAGSTLHFRYAHVSTDMQTATGVCNSRIELLVDGRIRLHETWTWESRTGSGTSVVEEIREGFNYYM